MWSIRDVSRTSATTPCPSAASRSQIFEPMNPVAPVTATCMAGAYRSARPYAARRRVRRRVVVAVIVRC